MEHFFVLACHVQTEGTWHWTSTVENEYNIWISSSYTGECLNVAKKGERISRKIYYINRGEKNMLGCNLSNEGNANAGSRAFSHDKPFAPHFD